MSIQNRKKDHVSLCVSGNVNYEKTTGFEQYDFLHNALPEIALDDIDVSAELLGRRFSFPLFISSMTGGYSGAVAVNEIIAEFCESRNLPFGVGSQRAMLERPEERASFRIAREKAPTAFIAANIGGCQLPQLTGDDIQCMLDVIEANALIIHLNPLQELMQPEGDRDFSHVLENIERLCRQLEVPVMVKETGAGISGLVAAKLYKAGAAVVDVAGAGGTSWSRVENARASDPNSLFDDWGIPTVVCLEQISALKVPGRQLIASGGIKNSLDIAKALCLGADFAAAAQPVIKAVIQDGREGLEAWFGQLRRDFTFALCLLGVSSAEGLNKSYLIKRQ
ncbi:isopentenyl-diphosphate delta-isomerase [Cyclonatronum proteinivorum]|uniref:Isopentenyl-diphosphate delta-isomerase n=1 Tax=Cyclonatronum proteinivorum TaxID=1457365 RepID=A0A345UK53_9BACT|nr:type 2 isopentenyl-diphosphate Delta-isomerase [Cyclonatronum proteinivorum]AXJ00855.1 isopentenyl-diphosphate delta-isomerase [Cyclonatronum proteinivorum]